MQEFISDREDMHTQRMMTKKQTKTILQMRQGRGKIPLKLIKTGKLQNKKLFQT